MGLIISKNPLGSLSRILLKLLEHIVLLEMAYLVASLTSDIDIATWSDCRVFFFLSLEEQLF